MSNEPRYECCSVCSGRTGRAGKFDDSLFLETPRDTLGPLCEVCHDALRRDDLEDEIAAITAQVEQLRAERDDAREQLRQAQAACAEREEDWNILSGHACLTGDCDHENAARCVDAIMAYVVETNHGHQEISPGQPLLDRMAKLEKLATAELAYRKANREFSTSHKPDATVLNAASSAVEEALDALDVPQDDATEGYNQGEQR